MSNYPHRDDNYPDDIRQYDDHPGSPFYEEPQVECEICGDLVDECDTVDDLCPKCQPDTGGPSNA